MPGKFGYSQLKRNGEDEQGGDTAGKIFRLLEIKPVKLVFGSQIKDSLDKCGAVLGSDRRREITGTGPSTDRDASHGTMCLSLLHELGDVFGTRSIKAKDGGIFGGEAKNT